MKTNKGLIVATVTIVIMAAAIGIALGVRGSKQDDDEVKSAIENKMSCNPSQMESVGAPLFVMAPARMTLVDDVKDMDSMVLECVADGEEPPVHMKMSSEQINFDSGETQTIWHGAMMGESPGFVTLIQSGNGTTMTGTFTTKNASYSVMTDGDGALQMKMTPWAKFLNGSAEEEKSDDGDNSTNSTESLIMANDTMVMTGSVVSMDVVRNPLTGPSGRRLGHSRELQSNTIRLLLIVTDAARCEYAGLRPGCSSSTNPFSGRVALLQDEMNNAMNRVGVNNAVVQIVRVVYLQPGFSGGPDVDTLNVLRTNGNVRQWRNEAQADLVTIITGATGSFCGIAYLNSPESSTRVDCLDTFTFSHELGHNFGGRHDRANSGTGIHPYGHGYRDSNRRLRTVMSYNCNGGCPVIPYFSANGYNLNGVAIGTPTEDNARLLRENAARTAQLY